MRKYTAVSEAKQAVYVNNKVLVIVGHDETGIELNETRNKMHERLTIKA